MPRIRLMGALLATAFVALPRMARAQQGYPKDTTQKADTTQKPDTMPKKEPPPKPAPVLNGLNFSAWIFGDFQLQTDSASEAANGGSKPNKFDIGRAYLTFQGPLGDRASFRVTTDIKQGGSTADYKGWFVRLKYGYLQYNWLTPTPDGASGFARLGMLHTVIIDHEENFWPRYLNKTAVELWGFMSSADLGVVGQLSFPNKLGEVYIDAVNGTGYESPENNKYKDFQARVTITPLAKGNSILKTLAISPWGSIGGNSSAFLNDPSNPLTDRLKKNRYGIFVGNRDRRLTFGADYAERQDEADSSTNTNTGVFVTTKGRLFDGFVIVRPNEFTKPDAKTSVGVVGRFDYWKPNTNNDGWVQFIVAGVFVDLTRKATLALDYQRQEPKSGLSGAKQESWFLHWNLVF